MQNTYFCITYNNYKSKLSLFHAHQKNWSESTIEFHLHGLEQKQEKKIFIKKNPRDESSAKSSSKKSHFLKQISILNENEQGSKINSSQRDLRKGRGFSGHFCGRESDQLCNWVGSARAIGRPINHVEKRNRVSVWVRLWIVLASPLTCSFFSALLC